MRVMPYRAVCIDSNNLDTEILMHSLDYHNMIPGCDESESGGRADGILKQLLAVGGGSGKEGEEAAADQGLTGIAPR